MKRTHKPAVRSLKRKKLVTNATGRIPNSRYRSGSPKNLMEFKEVMQRRMTQEMIHNRKDWTSGSVLKTSPSFHTSTNKMIDHGNIEINFSKEFVLKARRREKGSRVPFMKDFMRPRYWEVGLR